MAQGMDMDMARGTGYDVLWDIAFSDHKSHVKP